MVRLIAGTQEALSLAGGKGQEAPATPKWITPMLLFIDLYEKVSPVVPAGFFFKNLAAEARFAQYHSFITVVFLIRSFWNDSRTAESDILRYPYNF
jgi:hypothetical protein